MSTSEKAKRKRKAAKAEPSTVKEDQSVSDRARGRVLIVAVLLIVIVALVLVWNGLQSTYSPSGSTGSIIQVRRAYPVLDVKLTEDNSRWTRGQNDLPEYVTTMKWNICNEGNATANNTRVVGLLDGAVVRDYTWPAILPNACQNGDVDLNLQFDTAHRFIVNASSGAWSDSTFLEIESDLPRLLLEVQSTPSNDILEHAKLFVTPNDPVVREASKRIFQESLYGALKLSDLCPEMQAGGKCPNWMVLNAVEQWVENHITREGGSKCHFVGFECGDIHQTSAYAHLPRETLQSGMGDPSDIAILIVSLARASGLSSSEVFAVVGTNGNVRGAWVYDTVGASPPPHIWPPLHGLEHPCNCNALIPECCTMRAVYYFNDQVAMRA